MRQGLPRAQWSHSSPSGTKFSTGIRSAGPERVFTGMASGTGVPGIGGVEPATGSREFLGAGRPADGPRYLQTSNFTPCANGSSRE
jgi:hypothetical protein